MSTEQLPLYGITFKRPTAQAVVRIGLLVPRLTGHAPCLVAIHAGRDYDYRAARDVERDKGHTMPSPERAAVGVIGVGRWDGQQLLDVEPIEVLFAKGAPGFWTLSPADEQVVRERYAAARVKRQGRPISGEPGFDWGNT